MYTDAMQQIYASTTKVLVDSKQGSNLLYLPLDKLIQQTGNNQATPVDAASPSVAGTAPVQSSVIPVAPTNDMRARDGRSRDRDVR